MRILLLEDDRETREAVARGLAREGYEQIAVGDVGAASRAIRERAFDVAVLDIAVPGGSGFDVLRELREQGAATRVLLLTARGDVADRIEGLDRGADDYLVKPFSFGELLARLRALSRRQPEPHRKLTAGELRLDLERHVAFVGARRLDFTPIEFSLLLALMRAAGAPVSRADALREVWGYAFDPETNLVDVHVNRIRRKLEDAGQPDLLRTVRGAGYAMG